MSKRKRAAPPSLQLEIMRIVWERHEVTVGEVLELLSARRPIARNTVQTTLVRLEEKGWLKHRQVANAFRYSPAVGRQKPLGAMVCDLLDDAFEGSVEGLVMTLLQERPVSTGEAERIRRMIDRSEKKER